eukprot:3483333-Amphidinium_carterae.1
MRPANDTAVACTTNYDSGGWDACSVGTLLSTVTMRAHVQAFPLFASMLSVDEAHSEMSQMRTDHNH